MAVGAATRRAVGAARHSGMFSLLRSMAPRRAVRRVSSEGFYDSQSGVFVSTASVLRIFEHARPALTGSGAVEVVAPVGASRGRVAAVSSAEDVAAASSVGAASARFDCAIDDRAAAVAAAAAALAAELPLDVSFSDAADGADHVAAELVVGELADLGVRSLVFPVGASDVDDDDELRELLTVLGGIDVTGVPVRRRIGFRAAADVDAAALVALASSLEVSTFDAAADGGGGLVGTAALLDALAAVGVDHGADVSQFT